MVTKAYIDFDSCYYNLARVIYGVPPWTVITNRFNHIISVPHWLEGHFGVSKITYLASPMKVKLKTKPVVEVFNIDNTPDGRKAMTEYLEGILSKVRTVAPDATIVHKDSITVDVNHDQVEKIKKLIELSCTVGVGDTIEGAKDDCIIKKAAKKKRYINALTLLAYTIPMFISFLSQGGKQNGNYKDSVNVRYSST
ncbi:hypothetical protein ES703_123626 [subsurface metagenome]